MLFAEHETTTWQMVWMSGIAAALVIVPILANAFMAWLQTRSLNASSQKRSENIMANTVQQSERMEEKVREVATQVVKKALTDRPE